MNIEARLNSGQGAAVDSDEARLRARATEAAVKFEAFFIKQMMSQMRSATRELADEDSPLKNKINDDMTDLADGLVADAMAGQRAFGIADMMLKQLLPAAHLSSARQASPLSTQEAPSKPEASKQP
jgi:flagellar protein FlgJ